MDEGSEITSGDNTPINDDAVDESNFGVMTSPLASIEKKLGEIKAKKLKADYHGEQQGDGRAERVSQLWEIRQEIANLNAKSLGMSPEQLKLKKAELYRELNDLTPYFQQVNNVDILWGSGLPAGHRTCNVTALSIALEGMGITSADFKGDWELMTLILDAEQVLLTERSQKEEEKRIEAQEKLITTKDETKRQKANEAIYVSG